MEAQILSLLRTRPLVTANEAASLLNVSEAEVQPVLAAIASSNAGAYTLLCGTVEEAAQCGTATTKVCLQKTNLTEESSATSTASAAYALLSLTYPSHVAASAAPILLRPSTCDTLRVYPVVSRAVMESRPADAAPTAAAVAAEAVVPPTVVVAAKLEVTTPTKTETATSVKKELTAANANTQPSAAVSASQIHVAPVTPAQITPTPLQVRTVQEEVKPSVPEEVSSLNVVVKPEPVSQSEAPATSSVATGVDAPSVPAVVAAAPVGAAVAAPRTPSIFDKMKAAAATKRTREDGEAPPKAKKATTAKPKKAAKTENTTSLAKLARASKKKTGTASAAPSAAGPSSRSFLDEDDDGAMDGLESNEESTRDETPAHLTMLAEEAPVLDVVEVSASNDDVILCDDAPPLAFRPAEPVQPATATTAKKNVNSASTSATAGAAATEPGAAQCTLGAFFNPAVVEFQKSYVKEVQTEMKIENGEYVCVDVPCYKHKGTGDIISEAAYHEQTARLVRSHDGAAETPTHNAASANTAPDSPSTPAAKSTSRNSSEETKKSKSSSTPAKTLMSFFKPVAK